MKSVFEVGEKYGRLTIKEYAGADNKNETQEKMFGIDTVIKCSIGIIC